MFIYRTLQYAIAFIWIANGLFCKILNLVPRHTQIVATILHTPYARVITGGIGFSELLMAMWIISGIKARLAAVTQMIIIAVMNIIEFLLVPELLLWGRLNIIFAFLLIGLIYYHQFILHKKIC
ncbi:DoxX-like family protein [Niabella sp. 22666]|uniref:DoxX-like family protein n=1 Tax=Niabella sp. 22666 TaxID=3453954 RepID=UPI003F8712F0